jgi:hypothetical protein
MIDGIVSNGQKAGKSTIDHNKINEYVLTGWIR